MVDQQNEIPYLPLLDHGAQFVCGKVHAVEVGEDIFALDLFSHEAELPEGNLIVLQVSQGHLENTALQAISGNLCKYTEKDHWLFKETLRSGAHNWILF